VFFDNTGEKTMLFNSKNRKAGYTLIELVVVLLLTGILVAAVTPFVVTNVEAFIRIRQGKDTAQGARVGLLRMTEELKRASNIDSGDSNKIQFDFEDSDGNTHFNTVYQYKSDKQSLFRNPSWLWGREVIIATVVQDFNLTYFDAIGNTTTAANARRILIEMKVGPKSEQTTRIRTLVALRNLF
jgi:prepilin-type N-terminal cleavage/methylation domain-containing protein